jgi:catechol 2,3-dioxygenase-like lactoylglutathione lyase family enzyme
VKINFVAGFGPVAPEPESSRQFWVDRLGIELEGDDIHRATDQLEGVRAFSVWSLSGAAESCFGTKDWPADVPVPQGWIEFDVESAAAVSDAATELEGAGLRLLRPPSAEPWGQTVARLLSPEGLLVGITYTPWMHGGETPAA